MTAPWDTTCLGSQRLLPRPRPAWVGEHYPTSWAKDLAHSGTQLVEAGNGTYASLKGTTLMPTTGFQGLLEAWSPGSREKQ